MCHLSQYLAQQQDSHFALISQVLITLLDTLSACSVFSSASQHEGKSQSCESLEKFERFFWLKQGDIVNTKWCVAPQKLGTPAVKQFSLAWIPQRPQLQAECVIMSWKGRCGLEECSNNFLPLEWFLGASHNPLCTCPLYVVCKVGTLHCSYFLPQQTRHVHIKVHRVVLLGRKNSCVTPSLD